MDTKRCTKCGEEKLLDAFSKREARCKVCRCVARKTYREANKEKVKTQTKTYREANKEKLKTQANAYYEANREKASTLAKGRYEANREKEIAKARAQCKSLSDDYVRRTLRLPLADCTPELIQAKREQLLLHRTITNLKKEIANVE